MNNLALMFSSSAVAFVVGVGVIPQSSTEVKPYPVHQPVKVNTMYTSNQTASSGVEIEIMIMRRIGDENYRRIQEISCLSEGWDGYNAQPIPKEVIGRTKELLMVLPIGAKIFPTGRSSIQIEYHKNAESYLELEVSTATYEMYCVQGENEYEDSVHESEIVGKVRAFLA